MNERIRGLAEQQGFTGPNFYISSSELEKFALLTVKECVDICESGTSTQTTSSGAAQMIKQHFGLQK